MRQETCAAFGRSPLCFGALTSLVRVRDISLAGVNRSVALTSKQQARAISPNGVIECRHAVEDGGRHRTCHCLACAGSMLENFVLQLTENGWCRAATAAHRKEGGYRYKSVRSTGHTAEMPGSDEEVFGTSTVEFGSANRNQRRLRPGNERRLGLSSLLSVMSPARPSRSSPR